MLDGLASRRGPRVSFENERASRLLGGAAAYPDRPRRVRSKSVDIDPQMSPILFSRRQARAAERPANRDGAAAAKRTGGAFETSEMLAKRRALKQNPRVLSALKKWWLATDADGSGSIDKPEFVELLKAIYRVKVSADDEEDCQKCAEADAEEDFEGIVEMDEPRFHAAIFE